MTRKSRPDIFRYHDYRVFLQDWLAFLKAGQSGTTHQELSKKSGIASGYLSMVLKGNRNLSLKALNKIAPHLLLHSKEVSFLKALVQLGSSESQEERLEALNKMKRFQDYRKNNPKEAEVYQYLTHWYYVAIREMSALPNFKANPEWISQQLNAHVEIKDIREALKFLTENGFLELRPDGSAVPPSKNLDCLGGVFRVALTQFHHELLDLAKDSIVNTPSEMRSLKGHTLAIDQSRLDEAKAILDEAISKIKKIEQESLNKDSIYHFELALFPLTRAKKPEAS